MSFLLFFANTGAAAIVGDSIADIIFYSGSLTGVTGGTHGIGDSVVYDASLSSSSSSGHSIGDRVIYDDDM